MSDKTTTDLERAAINESIRAELLGVIDSMIVEYSNMAFANDRRYPSDDEIDLARLGSYGERALDDLKNRITIKQGDSNMNADNGTVQGKKTMAKAAKIGKPLMEVFYGDIVLHPVAAPPYIPRQRETRLDGHRVHNG